jgi:hypothetical protein
MGTGSEFSRISQHLQQEPWVSTTHSGHLTQLRPPHHSISAMLQRSSARSHGFILSSCQQFTTCGSTTPTAVSLCCSPPKTAISETTLCVCVCVHNGRARQRNHVIAPKVVGFLPRYTRQALPRTGDQKWITARRRSYFSRIGHRSSTNGLIFAAPATRHRFSGLEHPIEAY